MPWRLLQSKEGAFQRSPCLPFSLRKSRLRPLDANTVYQWAIAGGCWALAFQHFPKMTRVRLAHSAFFMLSVVCGSVFASKEKDSDRVLAQSELSVLLRFPARQPFASVPRPARRQFVAGVVLKPLDHRRNARALLPFDARLFNHRG